MKNECDIVGDLLFSYHDGVLCNSSKELVEEHLAKCEKCKTILAELTQEDTKKSQTKEVDFLKRIQKSSNKKNILIAVVCILFFVLVLFHLLVYNNYYEIASTMEVYLDNDITEQQIEDIKNKIIENSYNLELEYVSKEATQNRIKENLGEKGNVLNGYTTSNNPAPASIEIKTDTKIEDIVESIQSMPGIAFIATHQNTNPYELFFHQALKK